MAEEKNRVVADHLSHWLFCPTRESVNNLKAEGLTKGICPVGDVMTETFRLPGRRPAGILADWPSVGRVPSEVPRQAGRHEKPDKESSALFVLDNKPALAEGGYYYVTLHRAEAVDDPENLARLIDMLEILDKPVVLPLHPRTRKNLRQFRLFTRLSHIPGIRLLTPVGHRMSLWLIANAHAVLTDSGGVQKEAYWAKVRCFTMRTITEWNLLVDAGWNTLVGFDQKCLRQALGKPFKPRKVADDIFAKKTASAGIIRQLKADLT